MDLKRLDFCLKSVFCLLVVFTVGASGQTTVCKADTSASIDENNTIGKKVTEITVMEGVNLTITENPLDAFGLNGTNLVANKVLDFEALTDGPSLRVSILCSTEDISLTIHIFVLVQDINDNPPVFAKSQYDLEVDELSTIGTSVGRIEATDLDKMNALYYWLEAPTDEFDLQSFLIPIIEVKKVLDYDTTPEVAMVLFVQDTPLSSSTLPSHTASTTIRVTIKDVNNRPPWFQPCTETSIGTTKICLNSGYHGTVNLTEQAIGPLPLEPGPVNAIDGDKGRNEPISYTILGGNEDGIFSIDSNTGSITMEKKVDVVGPIILTVMAYETLNPDQFATTTVTLQVVKRSKHPPQFVRSSYEGFISEDANVGSLVLEGKTSNKPLQVQATDDDFANGVNPDIRFEVKESSFFRVTPEGFILMTSAVSPGIVDLEIRAVDTTNDEFGTASLSVEVTPGVPTTTTEMPTTTIPLTTIITSPSVTTDVVTTSAITTDVVTSFPITTDVGTSSPITTDVVTSSPITTDVVTSFPITTDVVTNSPITTDVVTNSPITTDVVTSSPITTDMVIELTTAYPDTITTTPSPQTDRILEPAGDFKVEHMAALGASLGAVLLLCLVAIGLLVCRVKQNDADWRKLSEASVFRSTLNGGSAGLKDGVQYTNEGFQKGEDTDSVSAKQAAELPLPLVPGLSRNVPEQLEKQSSTPAITDDLSSPPADSSSLSASDSEKEVKPILTKERRVEDGYKAVWFKQDIDPNVEEEVVIISHNGDGDVSHDDDYDEDEEEEDEDERDVRNTSMSAQRRDSDSDDDDDDEGLTSDL